MRASLTHSVAVLVFLLTTHVVCAHAEDGSAAWLRYAPIPDAAQYARLPSRLVVMGDSPSDKAAASAPASHTTRSSL
jgi:alpha-glucuronidase